MIHGHVSPLRYVSKNRCPSHRRAHPPRAQFLEILRRIAPGTRSDERSDRLGRHHAGGSVQKYSRYRTRNPESASRALHRVLPFRSVTTLSYRARASRDTTRCFSDTSSILEVVDGTAIDDDLSRHSTPVCDSFAAVFELSDGTDSRCSSRASPETVGVLGRTLEPVT